MTSADGIALQSISHPFNITDDMIAAGLKATEAEWKRGGNWGDMVIAVYTAMTLAQPPEPDFEIGGLA